MFILFDLMGESMTSIKRPAKFFSVQTGLLPVRQDANLRCGSFFYWQKHFLFNLLRNFAKQN